jgi:hypothetical protein
MSVFFLVGIFFLRHPEEVLVNLFASTVWGLAEKDEDVITRGEFSGLDRQRGELPIFAEPDFASLSRSKISVGADLCVCPGLCRPAASWQTHRSAPTLSCPILGLLSLASEDFPPLNGLEDYLIVRVIVVIHFHQQTRFSG